jgi:hypothetical protein
MRKKDLERCFHQEGDTNNQQEEEVTIICQGVVDTIKEEVNI